MFFREIIVLSSIFFFLFYSSSIYPSLVLTDREITYIKNSIIGIHNKQITENELIFQVQKVFAQSWVLRLGGVSHQDAFFYTFALVAASLVVLPYLYDMKEYLINLLVKR